MTREEAIKFLALVKVAYPTAYKDMDKESKLATVNMWHSTFHNVPFKIMEMAFDHFRRVSKFSPTVADMYDELKRLYYQAIEDDNLAYHNKDERILKVTDWVIKHTSPFRSGYLKNSNYNLISEEDLKILPGSDTPILLGKENDDETL